MAYRLVQTIAGFATALRAIAVDRHGLVYAAGDSEVMVFDGEGRTLRRWRTARPGFSVAVAADGSVWVGEVRQVQIFGAGGKLTDTWTDETRLGRVTAIGFAG